MNYSVVVIIIFLITFDAVAQWVYQSQITDEDLYTVVFVDSLYGWVGGSSGIILNTTDGGNNWTINSNSSRGLITSLDFFNRLKGWAVTSYGKILKTTDGGINWIEQYAVNTFLFKVTFLNENVGYVVASPINITQPITIFKTTNSGENWSPIIIPDLQTATSAKFIDESQGYVIGGFPAKIFKTINGGNNWDLLNPSDSVLSWFSSIDFKDLNNGLLGGFEWSSLYQTTNGGQNWIDIPLYVRYYESIIYKENKIWLLVEGDSPRYIIHSFDNGITWFPQIRSLIGNGILEIFFVNDKLGWAVGAFGKILKTLNSGYDSLKTPLRPSLEYPSNNFIFSDNYIWLRWFEIEGNLFRLQIATDSLFNNTEITILLPDNAFMKELSPEKKYFWRLRTENPLGISDWSEIRSFYTGKPTSTENENFTSLNFYLTQNYPNPFNPTTKIEFRIANPEFVLIKIFDILGREVITLVNEEKLPGIYEIEFDAGNLPSGIYFYRLISSSYTETKKMILLR